jgi:hypothetical protein
VTENGALELICHPATPTDVVRRLEVYVQRAASETLKIRYTAHGRISDLKVPTPLVGELRRDELWRHTCFEAFIGAVGAAYHEFNFAPSCAWAAYAFSGYRQGMQPLAQAEAPAIEVQRTAAALVLEATLRPSIVPARFALAAVLEENDGRLSYWALTHPADRPDFHHPGSFRLEFR